MPLNSLNQNTGLSTAEYQKKIGDLSNCLSTWMLYLQNEKTRLGLLHGSYKKQSDFLMIMVDVDALQKRVTALPPEATANACQNLSVCVSTAKCLYDRIEKAANIHRDTGMKGALKVTFFREPQSAQHLALIPRLM